MHNSKSNSQIDANLPSTMNFLFREIQREVRNEPVYYPQMLLDRREFVLRAAATTIAAGFTTTTEGENRQMFGMIGKMIAVPEQRDALIAILLKNAGKMPGCLSYIVAKDSIDANAVWITEVWESKASHDASLSLPSVKQAIISGKPLIASFAQAVVTEPVGGHGLASAQIS